MKNLTSGSLEIRITESEEAVELLWVGKSEDRDPAKSLKPYLDGLLNALDNKKVVIGFQALEYMNSSTIPPIIRFLKSLNDNGISTEVVYSKEKNWQAVSFKALEQLSSLMTQVTVRGE